MNLSGAFNDDFSFASDFVTPAQFFAERTRVSTPEHRLLLQVLVLALSDAQIGGAAGPEQQQAAGDALEWIMSDGDGPMSCQMICDALGINIGVLRRRLAGPVHIRYRHTAA